MKDAIIKIALASPKIRVADTAANAKAAIDLAKCAADAGAKVIVFPELTLTGATAGDLFYQKTLILGAQTALKEYIDATAELEIVSFVGLPVASLDRLYNGVAAISHGRLLGVSVASHGSAHFAPAPENPEYINLAGLDTVLGDCLIYENDHLPALRIFVEIGADATGVIPPSSYASLAGANLIVNPVSEAEYLGAADARFDRARAASARLRSAYAIVGAGEGESGTDGVYSAPKIVAENGKVFLNAEPFSDELAFAEIDLEEIEILRRRNGEFREASAEGFEFVDFSLKAEMTDITFPPERLPFVPSCEKKKKEACALALDLQAHALAGRVERAYAKCCVIGVSGGLDSTLAVLAAARAMDTLGRDRSGVIAVTMPCFGTTERTKSNALALAELLGCSVRTIDIKKAVSVHFEDISHPANKYDVVYENSQARERTQVLMDLANAEGGIVVGTGDLSELALGFATYNGDQMSMYGINSSIPKTLMRAIIMNAADEADSRGECELAIVLRDVVETPVSPELLPAEDGENKQHTETIVGPYELHDFFLWYAVGYGYSKEKILRLAEAAFATDYKTEEIRKYLDIFFSRFFSQQFKRSCMPDGPRVTKISLSPRGAWSMPSDCSASLWKK